MKAVKRLAIAIAVAGLSLGAPALAQDAAPPANSAAPVDSIGPRELQNFSLSGTVTKAAEQPPAPASARRTPPKPAAAAEQPTTAPESPAAPRRAEAPARETTAARTEPLPAAVSPASIAPRPQEQVPQVSSVTVKLPPPSSSGASVAAPGFAEEPASAPTLSPERRMPLWPWLLAAIALGAGGAFLFWRNRQQREAFAGGPQVDAFVAPEPAPRRAAAPVPPPAQPTAPRPMGGIVATRLRPWLDIGFTPLRCVVEQQQVVFEFEVTLANSGTASARDVLIEARMINASPTQEQEIAKFFANPVGEGDRIASIAPLKRVELRPRLAVPLSEIRVLGAGGRKVFVPLIVFNAIYNWGRDEGQSSAAFLVGRDTKAEKMAPFRLDLGPRLFRAVAGLELPGAIRR